MDIDRVTRCINFLSNHSIESFSKYIKAADGDTRDVIWWAEYSPEDVPLFDFRKPFEDNKI